MKELAERFAPFFHFVYRLQLLPIFFFSYFCAHSYFVFTSTLEAATLYDATRLTAWQSALYTLTPSILSLLIALLMTQILCRHEALFDGHLRGDLLTLPAEATPKQQRAFLFRLPSILYRPIFFFFLLLLLPPRLACAPLAFPLGLSGGFLGRLSVSLLALPLFFLGSALGTLSAMTYLRIPKNQNTVPPRYRFFLNYFLYMLIPSSLTTAVAYFVQMLPFLPEILLYSLPFLGGLLGLFLLVRAGYAARAILLRHRHLAALKRAAKRSGVQITDLRAPYRSLFFPDGAENLKLVTPRRTYSVSLLGATRKGLPLAIRADGRAAFRVTVRFFFLEVLRYERWVDYRNDSEDFKIIWLTPVPHQLFAEEGGARRTLDTGMDAYGYRLFSTSGLIGAIERDSLDARNYYDK